MASENRRNFLYVTAGVGLAIAIYRFRNTLMKSLRKVQDPLSHRNIIIIENVDECAKAVNLLRAHTNKFGVLGFDVEWVTLSGKRRPIALLQLSSYTGVCALFRLCYMRQIPKSLRELLEDDNVIKVGVGPQDDAQKLAHDYGVGVSNTFDLRFLAAMTGHKAEGLAKLSKSILNVQLDKHWRIVCSDWEVRTLAEKQQRYAANDALVAIEIFKKLAHELEPGNYFSKFLNQLPNIPTNRLEPFLDIRFREGYLTNLISNKSDQAIAELTKQGKGSYKSPRKTNGQTRGISTRAKAMYDNCLLQAPDGELLCTIDRRKAQWYINQNLGTEIENEAAFTVRLNFEPAGRAVGEVGRYYQTPKENQCVVCGRRDVYIRKNVVPREYRKYFPEVMKSHTSHDILLLCPNCHQLSNISDIKILRRLAEMCGAPLANSEGAEKLIEIPALKKIRSAARALLQTRNTLPEQRRIELENIVMTHFDEEKQLTVPLLQEAANIDVIDFNENYREHGEKVVECFQTNLGGLIELERIWREHFLNTMQPKYLPPLWSINHNADRLEIRAQEGRINEQDLKYAGLNTKEPV